MEFINNENVFEEALLDWMESAEPHLELSCRL